MVGGGVSGRTAVALMSFRTAWSLTQPQAMLIPKLLHPPEDGVFCDMMYDPVCDAFNTTYGNACVADSVNATIVCDGECPC